MLAAGVLLCLLGAAVRAEDFTYTTDNGEITITGYRGAGGAVTIPQTINNLPVTRIGTYALANLRTLTGVTVPEGIRTIEWGAFAGCRNLVSLTLAVGLTNIGTSAFAYCERLAELAIPASVQRVGSWAFDHCTSLTAVGIPAGVIHIDSGAFRACHGLLRVAIPASVVTIGLGAFASCPSLTAITVDALNPNYRSEDGVLFDKQQTTLIQYPGGKNGDYAVPANVTRIEGGAFDGCVGLTAIAMPKTLVSTTSPPFRGCTNLLTITVDALSPFYSSAEGVLFNKNGDLLIQYPAGRPGAYTVPGAVTAIGDFAFADCVNLEQVNLHGSVSDLGVAAFAGCRRLTHATLPTTLTSIPDSTFSSCTSLADVTIPAGVISLGDAAFRDCTSLTNITLPASLITIGVITFEYCTNLANIVLPASLTSIGHSAFSRCSGLKQVTIPNRVASLGGYAFQECSSLERVNLPASLEQIEDGTFVWCTSLARVELANGVGSIGFNAFYYCDALTQVTLPASVTRIEDSAFSECYNLTAIDCLGNAPNMAADELLGAINATVYYRAGTTGWGPTLGGRPTALRDPLPPISPMAQPFPIATNSTVVNVGGVGACAGTNFLAAYVSDTGFYAQVIRPDGTHLGSPILVGSHPAFTPGIAASYGDGNYLVLWSDASVSAGVSIFGQRIAPTGVKIGTAFPLLEAPGSHGVQRVCGVAFDGARFLVIWQDDATGFLYGQWVDGSGALDGPEFVVSDQPRNGHSAAVAFGAARCLVVWQSDSGPPESREWTYGVFVSKAAGVGSRIRISETPSIDQNPLAVAFDGDNFFVVWNQDSELTPSGGAIWNLYGRLVSAAGALVGPERLLSTKQPLFPSLAFDGDSYVLGWSVGADAGGSVHTVRLRFYDRAAVPLGPEFTPFAAQGSRQPLLLGVVAGPNQIAISCTLCDLLIGPDGEFQGFASGLVYGSFLPASMIAPRLAIGPPETVGQCRLRLTGTPGINYAIEFTTNPAIANWSAVVTNSPLGDTLDFVDTQATNAARCYRAVAVP